MDKYRGKDWRSHEKEMERCMMHGLRDKEWEKCMTCGMKGREMDKCTVCGYHAKDWEDKKHHMWAEEVHRMHPRHDMYGEYWHRHPEAFQRHQHYAGELYSPSFGRHHGHRELEKHRDYSRKYGGDLSGFHEMGSRKDKEKEKKWKPICDLGETSDHWIVRAEMPGVRKDKLEVEVEGKHLIILGKRKKELLHADKLREKMEKKKREKHMETKEEKVGTHMKGKEHEKEAEKGKEGEREKEGEKGKEGGRGKMAEKGKEGERGKMAEKGKEGERGKMAETGKEGDRGKEKRVCTNHNCSCGSNCTCGPTCKCGNASAMKEERKGDFEKEKMEKKKDEDMWKKVKWCQKERGGKGKFKRKIHLPKKVDPGSIDALYKDGILEIMIKKPEGLESKKKMAGHNIAIH